MLNKWTLEDSLEACLQRQEPPEHGHWLRKRLEGKWRRGRASSRGYPHAEVKKVQGRVAHPRGRINSQDEMKGVINSQDDQGIKQTMNESVSLDIGGQNFPRVFEKKLQKSGRSYIGDCEWDSKPFFVEFSGGRRGVGLPRMLCKVACGGW